MFGRKKHIDKEIDIESTIEELQKGSAEAFHILYHKYSQKIFRFCLRMLGDSKLAEDAFQETFIKLFEHKKDFRGDNFSAWLYAIARNTCLNMIRARKNFEQCDVLKNIPTKEINSDFFAKELIQKAIMDLPLALREAIILREYQECSYQEIADIVGIKLSLAKVRVHRARLILRKSLEPIAKEVYEH